MWVLEAQAPPAKGVFVLTPGEYTVGRVVGTSKILCLSSSISREHARIGVAPLREGHGDVSEAWLEGLPGSRPRQCMAMAARDAT